MNKLIETLKDVNGSISSKRVLMYLTFILWATELLVNLFLGLKMDVSLSVQLFSFLTTCLVLVFGEQIKEWIKANKKDNA